MNDDIHARGAHSDRRRPVGAHVLGWIEDFIGEAKRSLDLAHYDFHLGRRTASIVGGAIREAAARGVAVRFVYNVDHRNPIPVPPPPSRTRS